MPFPSHATASPSMMQERERSRAKASTISGKRRSGHCRGGCRAARGLLLARDDPEAVVVDLMQPQPTDGRSRRFRRQARPD